MAYKYQTRYTVRGKGYFPSDMLRYDLSLPSTPEDDAWIRSTYHRHDGEVEMMLTTLHEYKSKPNITRARWHSMGWYVTEVYEPEKLETPADPSERMKRIKDLIQTYERYLHNQLFPGTEF